MYNHDSIEMSLLNLVNALYTPILVSIFSDWLLDKDLCLLDTAFCNRSCSSRLHNIFSLCVVHRITSEDYYAEVLEWLVEKSIGLKYIDINSGERIWNMTERITVRDHRVALRVHNSMMALKVISTFSNVFEMRFTGGHCDVEELREVFQKVSRLENLFFPPQYELDSSICKVIAENCQSLIQFCCYGNHASIVLEKCRDLRVLEVDNSPGIMDGLKHCPSLQSLTIRTNYKSQCDTHPTLFVIADCCPVLTELNLAFSVCEASILQFAQSHPDLTSLKLGGSVPGKILFTIAQYCRKLKILSVLVNSNSENGFAAISQGCPHLQELNVSCNVNITDSAIVPIVTACRDFQRLFVHRTSITEQSVMALLERCPCPTVFADWTRVSLPGAVKIISGLSGIFDLKYQWGTISVRFDSGFLHLPFKGKLDDVLPSLKSVSTLTLSESEVDDACVAALLQQCPLLTKLCLFHTSVSSIGAAALSHNCRNLSVLKVDSTFLVDADIIAVLSVQSQLTELSLEIARMTDESLEFIGNCCTTLKKLYLVRGKITAKGVSKLLSCPKLFNLVIMNCTSVNGDFLREHIRSSHYLKTLSIYGNPLITPEDVEQYKTEVTSSLLGSLICNGVFRPSL